MKKGINILLILLLFMPLVALGQNPLNNPIVRAAMEAYAEQIAENPEDYYPYFARGKEYYNYGYNDKAFADICKAIQFMPESAVADLSQAHTLRALLYKERGEWTASLDDFNRALQLDPTSQYALAMRADLLCLMGDYAHAKEDYQLMLRRDSRSQEAYLGLARVAFKESNLGVCNDNLAKAQSANPTNPQFYMERGALYEEMGQTAHAADDYVSAMLYGENKEAVKAINALSKHAYDDVVASLTTAVNMSNDKGFYYYLRANIYKSNHRLSESIKDWNEIVENNYLFYHSVFFNRGYCYMHLGQFEYALDDMSHGIRLKDKQYSYYIERSRVYRVMGQYDKAAEDLSIASTFDPSCVEVLQEKALLAAEQGDYKRAAELYNEAVMYNADDAFTYILRAENCQRMGDVEGAVRDYEMVLRMSDDATSFSSLQGFALARLGRTAEAEDWMEKVLNNSTATEADRHYQAACLYAQTGNRTKAYQNLEKAFKAGYGDYYNIYFYSDSPITLAPLRGEADFRSLVQGYSDIF